VKNNEDFMSFNQSYVPVAVLLEGKFHSLFANKGGIGLSDSVQRASGRAFLSSAAKESKQIVVSDADIVTNMVSNTMGPLPMGELPLENYRFANREFFLNCIDYLVSRNRLFESRNKDLVLRLLDKRKVEEQRSTWQFLNIVLPIALVVLVGLVYQWRRKKKYGTIFTS
jgi:gliding-associated putative ABC transporter substrate-binding component GldG